MLRIMDRKYLQFYTYIFCLSKPLTQWKQQQTMNQLPTEFRITALEGTSPRHPPRSILVLSGRYHIMSNASIVNNCIMSTSLKSIIVYYYPQLRIGNYIGVLFCVNELHISAKLLYLKILYLKASYYGP